MEAIDLCSDEEPSQQLVEEEVCIIDDDEGTPAAHRPGRAAAAPGQSQEPDRPDLYVLDCGCQSSHGSLAAQMQQQASRLQELLGKQGGDAADAVADAAACLSCPHCSALLSAQDTLKLLGPAVTGTVYSAFAGGVKQLVQQGAHAQQEGTSPAHATVSVCAELWQEFAALEALLLGGEPPAGAGQGTGSKPKRGKKASQQQKPKQAPKPKAKKSSGGAWAVGTGYGGNGGAMTKADKAAMTAAADRQAAADAAMTQHLQAITATLQDPVSTATPTAAAGPSSSSGVGRKRGRASNSAFAGLSWPVCGVVLAGPLAWLLRLLFQNDSLMDVVARGELYGAAIELLRHVGSSTDLLALLQINAEDARDTTAAPNTSIAAGTSSSGSVTLMAALTRLEQQAKLYRRSAEQLMAGDEGSDGEDEEQTTAAVCLALDLSTLVQSLQDGLNLWTATLGETGALQIQPQPAAAAKQQPAPAANGGRMRWWGSSSPAQPPAAAAPSAEAVAAAAQAQRYLAAMQPHRFIEADLLGAGHYFARDAAANAKTNAGGEVMRRRLKRITEELGALSTSLPLSWDSSILLAVHADRLDVLRAVLLPHPDTPYGVGTFVFDILLPPEYPDRPPRVQFLTTGDGRWRANPNLYDCGKVCLSLLGTWAGPSWEPGVSTLLQVLVSLQSMVLVTDPYFNEPGYESSATTAKGKKASAEYNAQIRLGTATHALLSQLRRPDPVFGEAIRVHYSHQQERVKGLLQQWVREAQSATKQQLQEVVKQVQQELSKLPAPVEPPQQQQQQQATQPVSREEQPAGRRRRTAAARQQEQGTGGALPAPVIDLT